jgi:hypothetical protein
MAAGIMTLRLHVVRRTTLMFTPAVIRARLQQRPFVPLRIVTSSGQTFDVRHPDLAMVGVREVTVGTGTLDSPTFYDDQTRIAIMHITALQDLPTPAAPTGNGQG